jgi:hypothetical protein
MARDRAVTVSLADCGLDVDVRFLLSLRSVEVVRAGPASCPLVRSGVVITAAGDGAASAALTECNDALLVRSSESVGATGGTVVVPKYVGAMAI